MVPIGVCAGSKRKRYWDGCSWTSVVNYVSVARNISVSNRLCNKKSCTWRNRCSRLQHLLCTPSGIFGSQQLSHNPQSKSKQIKAIGNQSSLSLQPYLQTSSIELADHQLQVGLQKAPGTTALHHSKTCMCIQNHTKIVYALGVHWIKDRVQCHICMYMMRG